jgi:glucose/arabinose dehydrogenase
MRQIGFFSILMAFVVQGCGDDGAVGDASSDTAAPDGDTGAPMDSMTPSDSSPPVDTAVVDTGPPPPCAPPVLPPLATEEVAADGSFDSPLFVTQAPGNTDTLWVVERGGRIRLVRDDSIVGTFLDIGDRITAGGEQGLLGLAFHPDYATNGRFFVYYTSNGMRTDVVAEYGVSGDPDVANDAEVRRLIAAPDGEGNHNGGTIAFGPDGFLYVGMGDEGGGCDEHGDPGNGQSLDTLMGKLHRLDVDNVAGDFAAAGNPFEGGGGLPQIWAYGLRNPWRFSIDAPSGDIYIGDVGQNQIEEVNIQPGTSTGAENYGWRFFEADRRSSVSGCDDTGFDTIDHTEPQVVIQQGSAARAASLAATSIAAPAFRPSPASTSSATTAATTSPRFATARAR